MGDFDSDTPALVERAALNASRTERDLEDWIFEQVHPADGMRIADLGCGTGKQLFALADRLSAASEIVGVDISEQAVSEVIARARRERRSNVRAIRSCLDDCPAALPAGGYDLVLSTYAIYYAQDVSGLLGRLTDILRADGQVFLCGPGSGTNSEMIAVVRDLQDAADQPVPDVEDFMDGQQIDALGEHYGSISLTRMANTVVFTSAAEVLAWWRHHNMYRRTVDEQVQRHLERVFETQSEFRMTKNVLGVHARV